MQGLIQKTFWGIRAIVYKALFGRIGLPSYIGRPIFLAGCRRMNVGARFRLFPGARLEITKSGVVTIEDDVAIGQNFHLTCGKQIVIRAGACIAPSVCVTDTSHRYEDISLNILKQADQYSTTIIGEDCFIGYGAVINAGSVLGKHCIVGANAVVSGQFPDYSVITGNPGKVFRQYSVEEGVWKKTKVD